MLINMSFKQWFNEAEKNLIGKQFGVSAAGKKGKSLTFNLTKFVVNPARPKMMDIGLPCQGLPPYTAKGGVMGSKT